METLFRLILFYLYHFFIHFTPLFRPFWCLLNSRRMCFIFSWSKGLRQKQPTHIECPFNWLWISLYTKTKWSQSPARYNCTCTFTSNLWKWLFWSLISFYNLYCQRSTFIVVRPEISNHPRIYSYQVEFTKIVETKFSETGENVPLLINRAEFLIKRDIVTHQFASKSRPPQVFRELYKQTLSIDMKKLKKMQNKKRFISFFCWFWQWPISSLLALMTEVKENKHAILIVFFSNLLFSSEIETKIHWKE